MLTLFFDLPCILLVHVMGIEVPGAAKLLCATTASPMMHAGSAVSAYFRTRFAYPCSCFCTCLPDCFLLLHVMGKVVPDAANSMYATKFKPHDACRVASPRRKFRRTCRCTVTTCPPCPHILAYLRARFCGVVSSSPFTNI